MKTMMKTLTAMAAILLIGGCSAVAADQPVTTATPAAATTEAPAFKPGWRHEQMVQAMKDGKDVRMPMMMMHRMGGRHAAMVADGKIDPATLPQGCPFYKAPDAAAKTE